MSLINFKCKKCNKKFDCETGKTTFGNILDFEKDIICPKCGKLNIGEIGLTELGQTQIGEIYFSEEDEKNSILNLCDEEGTGFEAINEKNQEAFLPLLMGVEETIYLYSKNYPLEDFNVIESLKEIRDHIFSENREYKPLEKEIIYKFKILLRLNSYSKRDVSLSISKVLNSVKLHRSMEGKRGYLTFISRFFEELSKKGELEDE